VDRRGRKGKDPGDVATARLDAEIQAARRQRAGIAEALEQAGQRLQATLSERRSVWEAERAAAMASLRARALEQLDNLAAIVGDMAALAGAARWARSPDTYRPLNPAVAALDGATVDQVLASLRAEIGG
jgi:hypothetical protein